MQVIEKKYSVQKLIDAFNAGSLLRNPECQRGEAWTELQKAAFIDSIFRAYPVPALLLHETHAPGLDEAPSKKYEIVDGQQRLTALRDFAGGKFGLLSVDETSKLRLPKSVRARPALWAGKTYNDLNVDLQQHFQNTEMTVFQIGPEALVDEVRDLFIRLQSGTALTRQQIRDAWPGNLGPFIERLAGKLDKKATVHLFALIDKRGQRVEDEEQRDYHVADRQVCAQLLRVFIARERDPYAYPSVSANELDSLYHEFTDFDPHGETANRFVGVLNQAADVLLAAYVVRNVKPKERVKLKVRRLDVTAVMMFLQDVSKNPLFKLETTALGARIAKAESEDRPTGKSTSGSTLQTYYEWWRTNVAGDVGIRLDPRRAFDDEQRDQIRSRDQGLCQVCNKEVLPTDAEFDHFPIPYRDGGQTEVSNARLVHKFCHERGRPAVEA